MALNALRDWLVAKRHKRGFGIHSPFAFGFVTEVLCPRRTHYYAYGQITGHDSRARRIFFRICVRFDCPLEVCGDMEALYTGLHHLACGSHPRRPGLIVVLAPDLDAAGEARAAVLLPRASVVYVPKADHPRCRSLLESYLRQRDCGMMFRNLKGTAVFVADSRLPRQDFPVDF